MSGYNFLPYDDQFPELFEKEKSRIRNVLGPKPIIEHLGSTAVPGLGGKGFIDIYVVVPKEDMEPVSEKIQKKLGYIYKADAGVAGKRIFHETDINDNSGKKWHYHLHVTYLGSQSFREGIAFRNYLIAHPDEARRYADVKKMAIKEVSGLKDRKLSKQKYLDKKGDLINEMTRKALAEFSGLAQ